MSTNTTNTDVDSEARSSKRQRTDDNDNAEAESSDATVKVNSRYQSDDADIILVSADDIQFRVHSYVLMTASPVFRTMIALGNKHDDASTSHAREVSLADADLEDAHDLVHFLDLIYGRDLEEWFKSLELDEVEKLIMLVRKYDASPAQQLLKLAIYRWLEQNRFDSLDVFIMGCRFDDVNLCAHAIRGYRGSFWGGPSDASSAYTGNLKRDPEHGAKDRSILDLSVAPLNFIEKIPDPYKFALMRAALETDNLKYEEAAFERMAVEFETLMSMIKSKKASSASASQ